MNIWLIIAFVFAAGAVGGCVNAIITDNGFFLPITKEISTGIKIWRPGFMGNIIIGGVASLVSWSLYGPLSTAQLFETSGVTQRLDLPVSALGGAIIVGIAGAKWLTNEVDKRILKIATSIATEKADPLTAAKLASATPIEALELIDDIDVDFETEN